MKTKMFKKRLLTAAIISIFPVAAASAATITFTAPSVETLSGVSTFDWAPANVIAINGNQAFVNHLNSAGTCPAGSCDFQVFSHAKLSNFLDAANNPTITNTQGTNYQITYELTFGEKVNFAAAAPGANIATFAFDPAAASSFKMYYDPIPNASDLAGTGFGLNPGAVLILSGTVAPEGPFTSGFNASTDNPVNLGSSVPGVNAAGWGATQTVSGSGSTTTLDLFVTPTFVNSTYLPATLDTFLLSSISQNLAYTTVDPSLSFPGAGIGNTLAVVGPLNGGTTGGGVDGPFVATNPSIIFQTDPNSNVGAAVPEPGILALLGIGLAGLSISSWNRRQRNG